MAGGSGLQESPAHTGDAGRKPAAAGVRAPWPGDVERSHRASSSKR